MLRQEKKEILEEIALEFESFFDSTLRGEREVFKGELAYVIRKESIQLGSKGWAK